METLLEFEHMRLDKEGKLAWLTFTRERYLNAMNNEATAQLNRTAMALREDPDLRVVVIRGQGRAFCTGIDLKELAAGEINVSYFELWEKVLRIFEMMDKIVIVGLHGYCLGGALQLAIAADIRVSTPDCQIGLPAIKESLIPGLGPWRLPKYIGWGRAKRMVLGGENIDGKEAFRIGLIDHLVPAETFFSHVDQIARDYLKACSTGTRMSKMVLNQAYHMDFGAIYEYYMELQERTQYSLDGEEGKRAYTGKRDPKWQ